MLSISVAAEINICARKPLTKSGAQSNAKFFRRTKQKTQGILEVVFPRLFVKYGGKIAVDMRAGDLIRGSPNKWHMTKYISGACALFGDDERDVFPRTLWRAIRSGDKDLFSSTVRQMKRFMPDMRQRSKIELMRAYVMNHWEGIQNQKKLAHGCSAEGHVSHVLSARLSSRPMVWSAEGAHRMSLLRTYRANGGNVLSLHLGDDKPGRKIANVARMRRTLNRKLKGRYAGKQVTMPILHSGMEEELKNVINSLFRDRLM